MYAIILFISLIPFMHLSISLMSSNWVFTSSMLLHFSCRLSHSALHTDTPHNYFFSNKNDLQYSNFKNLDLYQSWGFIMSNLLLILFLGISSSLSSSFSSSSSSSKNKFISQLIHKTSFVDIDKTFLMKYLREFDEIENNWVFLWL